MSQDVSPSAEPAAEQQGQPTSSPPPPEEMASVWPAVVLPAVVIAVAAIAGYLANIFGYASDDVISLSVGTGIAVALVSLVVFRILGRHRTKSRIVAGIAITVGATALLLAGLGMVGVRDIPPATGSAESVSVTPRSSSVATDAGHAFTQQDITAVRDFRGADLRGARLLNLNLQGIDFSGANAAGASFEGSRLDRAIFRGANLGGAVLNGTCLRHTILHGADLTGAHAIGADVTAAEVTPAETEVMAHWPVTDTPSKACEQG